MSTYLPKHLERACDSMRGPTLFPAQIRCLVCF
jgi:hypothetical protein